MLPFGAPGIGTIPGAFSFFSGVEVLITSFRIAGGSERDMKYTRRIRMLLNRLG
jgi:hypothetical protein